MKNRVISLTIISLIALTTASCTKEFFGRGDNHIRAVVSAASAQTKSGQSADDVRFIGCYTLDGFGADSLCVAVYEFDNTVTPQTKGAVITTDGIKQNGQQFTMDAWLESTNRYSSSSEAGRVYDENDATNYHFMKDATATRVGSSWTLGCTSPSDENWNIWRNKVPTNFWAMYPTSLGSGTISSLTMPADDAADDAQKTISFNYTLPDPDTVDYIDAENQQDLCFAYSRKAWDEDVSGNDNAVNVCFYHALSAVYFDISGVLSTIKVNKIGFNSVPSTAHCEILGTSPAPENGNPGVPQFLWTGQSDLVNFGQSFENTDFDSSSKRQSLEGSNKVFLMIPGTLNANTELWAEFEVDGSPVTKSVNISKYSPTGPSVIWKPGKYYLYKLAFSGSGDLHLAGGLGPYMPDWF